MDFSSNTVERICRIFGYLDAIEKEGKEYVSSKELAKAVGATDYTLRKDISIIGITKFTRKGYEVSELKEELGKKLSLDKKRRACIVGLGRLGMALLDYEKFQDDGFEIIAGFDSNINKLERIKTHIDIFPDTQMGDIIRQRAIELGIIAVPAQNAQVVSDKLIECGVRGILNFSPIKVEVPERIVYLDMDFTNALRYIAAQL